MGWAWRVRLGVQGSSFRVKGWSLWPGLGLKLGFAVRDRSLGLKGSRVQVLSFRVKGQGLRLSLGMQVYQ